MKRIKLSEFKLIELSSEEQINIQGYGLGKDIGKGIGHYIGEAQNAFEWFRKNFKQPPELIGVK